jgi:MFS family permease
MHHRFSRVIVGVEYALGTIILLLALYLITGPLHAASDDGHNGLLGVFSGLILLSFSVAIFVAARAMRRGGRRHWLEQSGVIILCLGLFTVMWLSRS